MMGGACVTEPLAFFDANVMAGRPRRLPGAVPWEERPLGDLLDEFGLAEALVWHIEGKEVEPNWGNERVLEATADDVGLVASGVIAKGD